MSNTPLAIVVGIVSNDNKVLLIKRSRGAYMHLWGIPGGKVECHEHISQAAVREIKEECGLNTHFKKYLGTISEHLVENKKRIGHFIIHVCELRLKTINRISKPEHEMKWFDMHNIAQMKQVIIPSDILIIEKMYRKKQRSYFNCTLEKVGALHILRKIQ
jgi:mutator protein MutT